MPKLSVVVPVYFNEGSLPALEAALAKLEEDLRAMGVDLELIFVNDASRDRSLEVLKKIQARRPATLLFNHLSNQGALAAVKTGLRHVTGDCFTYLAADLQDPPELIPELVAKWEAGFKTVLLVKPESEESRLMFAIRRIYYGIIAKISDVPLVPNATGAGLFDRAVVDILRGLREPYPYLRGLVCEIGFPIATVPFLQPRRRRGISKNNFYTLYDIAMLGVTSHSKVPLRLMTMFGFLFSLLSFMVAMGFFVAKLLFWDYFQLGLAPLLIGLFFFMAVQMFFIGLLGEYIGAVLTQVRNVPHVIEAERINFNRSNQPPLSNQPSGES